MGVKPLMQALLPVQLARACASITETFRLLGAGKLTVTVPVADDVLPCEFCTEYWKLTEVADEFAGIDRLNPPWGSPTMVPPVTVGAGMVTRVRGRPLGSELPNSKPGDGILMYVAVFAV